MRRLIGEESSLSGDAHQGELHLVVTPTWIGDTAMSAPFFSSLRRAHPEARLMAAAGPWTSGLLRSFPWVDRVLSLDAGKWSSFISLRRMLKNETVDYAWILPNSFRAALMAKWIGARRQIGYGTGGRGWLLSNRVVPPRDVSHLVDRYLYLLEAEGYETQVRVDDFFITPESQKFAENLLKSHRTGKSAPLVGIHPGAFFGESKTWPLEYFQKLIHRLVDHEGAQVFILGGPDELTLTGKLNAMSGGRAVNLAGKDSLETLPALLSRLDVFISGDTGPLHVAALAGTATIALFGPTDYRRTAPRGLWNRTIHRNLDCSPCFARTCPLRHHDCMKQITPEEVASEAIGLLNKKMGIGKDGN